MKTHLLFLSFYLVFFASIRLFAFSGSGSGTSGDPYLVTSASQIDEVRNNLTTYYKQTIDIDISGYSNWSKIGTTTTAGTNFIGTYDGNGYKITGLIITSTTDSYNGLFGVIGSGGTVKNLGVTGASVSSSTAGLGILAGYNYGGTVENCYSTGTVTSSGNNAGGLLGTTSGAVMECYSSANVTANGTSSTNIGGLIGNSNSGASISQCYCTGNVMNNGTSVISITGGFIGIASCSIDNCYSSGNVQNSTGRAGGFMGGTGANTPAITNCYSVGHVTAATQGGFVGYYNTGTFTSCYFDSDKAGMTNTYGGYVTSAPTGITAKTTAEMKTQSTFTDAGGNFTTTWEIVSGFYPRLKSIPDPALPVELTFFIASVSGNTVALRWNTATEVNNYGFEIERRAIVNQNLSISSPNRGGLGWGCIGFVAGNGTSNAPKEYSFMDITGAAGSYVYRLKQIDQDGSFKYSQSVEVTTQAPKQFSLAQNYPNPFNPTTTIEFTLAENSNVTLKIFDILGREVTTLVDGGRKVGVSYKENFDASKLASGLYFYRLQTEKNSLVKKLMLLK